MPVVNNTEIPDPSAEKGAWLNEQDGLGWGNQSYQNGSMNNSFKLASPINVNQQLSSQWPSHDTVRPQR